MDSKNEKLVGIKAAIKKYGIFGRYFLHGHRVPNAPSYSDPYIWELSCTDSKDSERTIFTLEGGVSGGHTDSLEYYEYDGQRRCRPNEGYRPQTGFWSIFGATDYFISAIKMLPDDAVITFDVNLDGGTSSLMYERGLHVDKLILNATWKRGQRTHERKFIIDIGVGLHNCARFGDCKL